MTTPEAMIDTALTIRVWQRERLEPIAIARQIQCAPSWDAIENAIVIDLLMRDARQAPARLAA
jgi:hypothetical protein